ncbi:right-handed parallel beta-helix repeat-containing protein, partial [Clostridium perfringens]
MSGCKGEINILNSSFSNPHDDPINIHGTFLQVVERISDREFKVQYRLNATAVFPNFYVGDELEFMTKGNMIPVEGYRAKVAAVQGPTGDSNDGNLTDITITLDKDMPKDIVANGYVVENITYTP